MTKKRNRKAFLLNLHFVNTCQNKNNHTIRKRKSMALIDNPENVKISQGLRSVIRGNKYKRSFPI